MYQPVRVVEGYIHNARVGVLVEIALETSFTAGMAEFKQLAKELALQIAAYPAETTEALLAQAFFRDDTVTVGEHVAKTSNLLRERIVITRFVRWDTDRPLEMETDPPNAPAAAARGVA